MINWIQLRLFPLGMLSILLVALWWTVGPSYYQWRRERKERKIERSR